MKRFTGFTSIALLSLFQVARGEVDFAHEVVPILKTHCAECHGGKKAKGGFSLNTKRLFLEDDAAIPGDSAKSLFLELIQESDPELQMPPEKKERVPPEQVAILKSWIDQGMKWEPGFSFDGGSYEPPFEPRRPTLPPVTGSRTNPVDRIIDQYLKDTKQPPLEAVDDSTFLRRAYLDLSGLLPNQEQVRAFLEDPSSGKREKLVEQLLNDEIHYADHWLTFWNDLLRNDYTGTGFITKGRTQITGWLYDSLKQNKPFHAMVRELIAPDSDQSSGFINGIKWRGEVSAGQTLPIQFSQSLSQSFLGINMKCASCHDSFIDRWTLDDAYGLAAIYSDTPLEIHRCDKPVGETAKATWLFPQIGNIDASLPKADRLKQLADLMTHPGNGRVPRTIVNRLWGQLMGRGIVHPLDAMQTPPWSEDLLDFLASDFQDNNYDLQSTLRLIATSQAYQSRIDTRKIEGEESDYRFAGPRTKRMTAEQFVDAIWQLTETAPSKFDANIVRGITAPAEVAKLSFPGKWIWSSTTNDGIAAPGAKVLLKRNFKLTKPVRSGGMIATADNSFTLYLNNQEVLKSNAWEALQSTPILNQLRNGNNQILLVAANGGDSPNWAGAFCAIRIVYEDGTSEVISTEQGWEATDKVPKGNRPNQWKTKDLPWEPARSVKLDQWNKTIDPQIGRELAAASAGTFYPVRASLVKSDFLMRSLGRPNRDQIVTSRPGELTTLEALELANNEQLSKYLQDGANSLARDDTLSTSQLIDYLYLSTLSRYPDDGERDLLRSSLGEEPDPTQIADALWAVTMTPEFLLIR